MTLTVNNLILQPSSARSLRSLQTMCSAPKTMVFPISDPWSEPRRFLKFFPRSGQRSPPDGGYPSGDMGQGPAQYVYPFYARSRFMVPKICESYFSTIFLIKFHIEISNDTVKFFNYVIGQKYLKTIYSYFVNWLTLL